MRSIVNSIKIDSYDLDKLVDEVKSLLAPLGGLEKFVKPGMRVLINPNLLSARTPERAVTTNPDLVAAVASMCVSLGAKVLIGDSPGGVEKGLKRVWDNTGMSLAAEKSGAELVAFESGSVEERSVEDRKFHISRYAFDSDFIISLPKLKTHVLTHYTGAIKNCYGFIPGLRKADYHKQYPDQKSFSGIVVDIFSLVKPGLFIMDAGLAMEGDGPASGTPRWLGYLFASTDGVALDASIASLLDGGKRKILPTAFAAARNLGEGDVSNLDLRGEAFKSGIDNFKMPANAYMKLIPSFLVKSLEPYLWVRPAINQDTCTMCRICLINCPQKVIYESDGKMEFNYADCIKCMCCHELCPYKSVYLERSRLAKLIG